MSLQVSLKLKLNKQVKKIKVKYNTFEKATYDEYLISSLALRTVNNKNRDKDVFEYIDNITGDGSLNKHFRNIYSRVKTFTQEQLGRIMENSMIPTLKIDERNRYDYYSQLDISVFKGRIYQGDLVEYKDLPNILMINEEIIDMAVETVWNGAKAEQYSVMFDENQNVKVKISKEYVSLKNEIFEKTLCLELGNIGLYKGKIHDNADGDEWHVLNTSVINNLVENKNTYYEDGDHFLIRNDSVRKTIISKVHGLYIYKQKIIQYQGNADLCDKVIDILIENRMITELKPKSVLSILKYVSYKKAQQAINDILVKNEEREVILYGLDLLEKGIASGWQTVVLKMFLKYASAKQLNIIYQADSTLNYTIEQLIKIDMDLLQSKHKEQVEKYYNDLEAKKKTIIEITGIVTTKGLRENAKKLEADEKTKRFSTLCNRLIGHVEEGLDDVSLKELDQWHKDALELKEISLIIEKRLKEVR